MRGWYKTYKRIQQLFMDIHFSHQIGRSLPNSLDSIHIFYLLSREVGHSYAHTRKCSSLWATKELDSTFNLIIHESSRKHYSKSHVDVQIERLQKTLFLAWRPYCRLCNSEHTGQDMLMLPQKITLIEFSRLQEFRGSYYFWWENTNFPNTCSLLNFQGWCSIYLLVALKVNSKISLTRWRS